MANETMRIFFPLKIVNYPQYDCTVDEREDISSREAVQGMKIKFLPPSQRRTGTLKTAVALPNISTMKLSIRIRQWRSSKVSYGELWPPGS
ncbi:hypothetical protein [Desulfosporosinus shakirovi]